MKCFYHPDADAIAVCHVCGRGTCSVGLQELEHHVVCSSTCKVHIENTYREYFADRATNAVFRQTLQLFGLINLGVGIVIISLGAHVYDGGDYVAGRILGAVGLVHAVWGVFSYLVNRAASR